MSVPYKICMYRTVHVNCICCCCGHCVWLRVVSSLTSPAGVQWSPLNGY